MDHPCPADGAAPAGESRFWSVAFLGLAAWHAWLTLTLFGADRPLDALRDERPIVSGNHPLHLYFGWLGASSLRCSGRLDCLDPAFQAGYPKTPVFDSGSRPAELFLTLAGGSFRPQAYKLGLAACCLAVPWVFGVAARGAGLSRASTALAVAAGLLLWWGDPCRKALEAGDVDLLLGGLCAAAFAGLLLAYDRAPGVRSWLGMLISGALGWLGHPFLFLLLFPLLLCYYLGVGPRHRLGWHLALLTVLVAAPGLNLFWLVGWVQSWWLRLPVQLDGVGLAHRTFHTFWQSACWGEPADRALVVAVTAAAAAGVALLNQARRRTAARLFGLGAGGLALLTLAGLAWPSLGRFGTVHLVLPALWFAIPPAVFALSRAAAWLGHLSGGTLRGVAATAALVLTLALFGYPLTAARAQRLLRAVPFEIGLGPEREALVEALRTATTPEARILWEEQTGPRETSRWTALLPLLTGRAFLGGLGPDLCIEHAYASLVDHRLAGRPIAEWSDAELDAFCRRYNVGWAVCRPGPAAARLSAWKDAQAVAPVGDVGGGCLYGLKPRSYVLKGQARWEHADARHLTLTDVVPEDGQVVLSLHYRSGLQVSPARVHIEREPDPQDPIPLVRLRVPSPVSHLTLTWQPP
jgi:hypothetical protein